MIVNGEVLEFERRKGTFKDRETGAPVEYDFTVFNVFDGRAITVVRLPSEISSVELPFGVHDTVSLNVTIPGTPKILYVSPVASPGSLARPVKPASV